MLLHKISSPLALVLFGVAILVYPVSSTADDEKIRSSYGGYCSGPGFSEPRGFGYDDRRQWRSDYREKTQDEREAYLERTRELRRRINTKERALAEEMDRADVDKSKAMKLQKELSALKSQMEQYQLEHVIEMKKIVSGNTSSDEGDELDD